MISVAEWCDMLQEQALRTRSNSQELMVYLNVWRDGDGGPVATFVCRGRDEALFTAKMAAVGMEADRLGITFEGWRARDFTNPDTGEAWGQGEMAKYMEDHPVNEVIYQGILTYVASREGDGAVKSAEIITKDEDGGAVAKDDDLSMEHFEGFIPDQMNATFKEPTLSDLMEEGQAAQVLEDLGWDRKYYHQDRAVMRHLTQHDQIMAAMLFARPGTERERLIEEQMQGASTENIAGMEVYSSSDFLGD